MKRRSPPMTFAVQVIILAMLAGKDGIAMSMTLTSSAFPQGGDIPPRYTCDGDDILPPLAWSGIPPGTKSLALIIEDPDAPDPAAPKRTWTHAVLYDLPPDAGGLKEGVTVRDLPRGARSGNNDWQRAGYGGPCPPVGRHRYFFKLYALRDVLPDLGKPNRAALLSAMEGKILEHAELLGYYQSKR